MVLTRDYDYTVADANDPPELDFYVDTLVERRAIAIEKLQMHGLGMGWKCAPTIIGWNALQPSRQAGGVPGTCFVALAMAREKSPDMELVYNEAIKPALLACDYKPTCMFDIKPIDGIFDQVLAEVRQAEFVIADFTHHRQSVYFEAGFAKGLGRQVVCCVHETGKDDVHFDTRHLGHVIWKRPADLKQSLVERIQANILRPT